MLKADINNFENILLKVLDEIQTFYEASGTYNLIFLMVNQIQIVYLFMIGLAQG